LDKSFISGVLQVSRPTPKKPGKRGERCMLPEGEEHVVLPEGGGEHVARVKEGTDFSYTLSELAGPYKT
jgi:hypothetical protein